MTDSAPRILIDLMSDGSQFEFTPSSLGIDAKPNLTADDVIAALKQAGGKSETARDLDLFAEDTWKLYVQVNSDGGWTRAEW